ncbi:MAG: transglycosylase SLT domain-containing protein [Gemmatimonadaceae bacterium]|nr:transglycosylase SLT domain-containing protein [Gemmatimonadaceae bacterium]NUR35353.1 transglycosylase SLT domain-containing protein [Gemmatimonadaceae bacterium]
MSGAARLLARVSRVTLAASLVATLVASLVASRALAAQRTPADKSRVADSTVHARRGIIGALRKADSARASDRDASRYDDIFRKYSKRWFGSNFDWRFFKAQGMAESELNPTARSAVGARGIMQLMPSTFQAIATKRSEFRSIDDPEWNIAAGIMHDRWLWTVWQKRVPDEERHRFMFGSYNAGEGPILRACLAARSARLSEADWRSIEQVAPKIDRWRYRETLGYVRKIDGNYARLRKTR